MDRQLLGQGDVENIDSEDYLMDTTLGYFSTAGCKTVDIHTEPLFSSMKKIMVQDLALGLVELHEVCMCPLFKPVQFPLDATTALLSVTHTTWLGVISALDPIVCDKVAKQHQSQY
ncbi:hypothetical protein HGM15179_002272 [Zosterops borbonicus]|uniref:Uncharacterized protein n=1 Tax=Zosterops borbonicus TaxID=364589 RepID=A0A8K1GT19_9PASS|nr:hypothetical protein HGM15179_002272 [Zosterops borbonicus]